MNLIANHIDWQFIACLDYFIFFTIDSSEARKQYDEYCLSIMQTITMHMTKIRLLSFEVTGMQMYNM
jgi:hypothetical protein